MAHQKDDTSISDQSELIRPKSPDHQLDKKRLVWILRLLTGHMTKDTLCQT